MLACIEKSELVLIWPRSTAATAQRPVRSREAKLDTYGQASTSSLNVEEMVQHPADWGGRVLGLRTT
jgi:hypothetical protein